MLPRPLGLAAIVLLGIVGCSNDTPLDESTATNTASALAIAANSWTRMQDLPLEMADVALAASPKPNGDTWLYAIGGEKVTYNANGFAKFTPLGTVYVWNPAKNTWGRKTNSPYVWWYQTPQAQVIGTKIYMAGGASCCGGRSTVAVYDIPTNTWSVINAPQPAHSITTWALDGSLYYAGRCDDDSFGDLTDGSCETSGAKSPFLLKYTPATGAWKYLAPPPRTSWAGMAAGAVGGLLYMTSAGDGSTALDAYDPKQDRWLERQPLPRARWQAAGVALGGKFYVLGGAMLRPDLSWGDSRATSEYSLATNSWRNRAQVPEILYGSAARVVVGGQARIAFIGSAGLHQYSHHWQFAP